jgi:hypothetical protein
MPTERRLFEESPRRPAGDCGCEPRCLPQGCQIDEKYTEEEWLRFVEYALAHWESTDGIDNEYYAKRPKHPVPDSYIRRTIDDSAELITYNHWNCPRVGIWREETGVLLVIRIDTGTLYNALDVEDIHDPGQRGDMQDVKWLKP